MATFLGSLRRLVLTPKLVDVTFAKRGFPAVPGPATDRLEAIPQAVICGFEWGIDSKDQWEVERRLALVEPEQRGFAYEGAAMAYTVRDVMGKGGTKTRDLLLGEGHPHIFLTYIGIGFAMARLPRVLWKKILPDLSGSPFYPVMNWLVVDGYGFDLAYFDKKKYIDEQREPAPYPFEGYPDYFPRAVDQGIGRALWFVHGARPADVAAAVNAFPKRRHTDLWSGVGLAATFAGGCDRDGFAEVRRLSGSYWSDLAVGSVFAFTARTFSGFVPPHSVEATEVFTGVSTDDALAVAGAAAVDQTSTGPLPQYEVWRQRIRAGFESAAQDAQAA